MAISAVATPEASASWGSQLNLAVNPPKEKTSWNWTMRTMKMPPWNSSHQRMMKRTMSSSRARVPLSSVASRDGGITPASPLPSWDMLSVWGALWPAVVAEKTRSRYKGKKLPLAESASKQLLPVFQELLDEVTHSWRDCLYSSRSQIPRILVPTVRRWRAWACSAYLQWSHSLWCISTPTRQWCPPGAPVCCQVRSFSVNPDREDVQDSCAFGAQCPLPTHSLSP